MADPASTVVSFGKYKGLTVAELLARDPGYADWLMGQRWLAERFAELHAAIQSRGAGNDDTPEHNQIQSQFLDVSFRTSLLYAVAKDAILYHQTRVFLDVQRYRQREVAKNQVPAERWHDHWKTRGGNEEWQRREQGWQEEEASRVAALAEAERELAALTAPEIATAVWFEHRGIDVLVGYNFWGQPPRLGETGSGAGHVAVEIKPSLGDDYPTVMRQMARLGATVLLIDAYAGTLPLSTVKAMFAANNQTLVTLQEVTNPPPHRSQ